MTVDLSSGTYLQDRFKECEDLTVEAFTHQVFIKAKSEKVDIFYPWDGFENGRWKTRPALVYPSGDLYLVGHYMNEEEFTPQLYRVVYAERRSNPKEVTYHHVTSVRSQSDYLRLHEVLQRLKTMPARIAV